MFDTCTNFKEFSSYPLHCRQISKYPLLKNQKIYFPPHPTFNPSTEALRAFPYFIIRLYHTNKRIFVPKSWRQDPLIPMRSRNQKRGEWSKKQRSWKSWETKQMYKSWIMTKLEGMFFRQVFKTPRLFLTTCHVYLHIYDFPASNFYPFFSVFLSCWPTSFLISTLRGKKGRKTRVSDLASFDFPHFLKVSYYPPYVFVCDTFNRKEIF